MQRPVTRTIVLALLAILCLGGACNRRGLAAEPIAMDFDGTRWIWVPSTGAGLNYPAAANFFCAALEVPKDVVIDRAELLATCDNLFAVYVNGKPAGESDVNNDAWHQAKRLDVTGLVQPGHNALAVEAVNTLPGPAAMLLKLVIRGTDGRQFVLVSDAGWRCTTKEIPSWQNVGLDHESWLEARVIADYGGGPWKQIVVPSTAQPSASAVAKVHQAGKQAEALAVRERHAGALAPTPAPDDFDWPEAIVYVDDDCSLYRPSHAPAGSYQSLTVTVFNPRNSRGFPEHDLPSPMKVGHKLCSLAPVRPGQEPRVLIDAGKGAIGSPSVSFDGRTIYFSMVPADGSFYHVYRIAAEGGTPEQLTEGPFHDIDPVELPDGRIVFTSTRSGTFDEYHAPPSRGLFTMNPDGGNVQPITATIIFDNEPEILADGRILFIRSDNFFDRGKVETLLHAVHPDGTEGYTEFGLDMGPEYGGRLRAFTCGSPAPMPDGRVAFVSGPGITIGRLGTPGGRQLHFRMTAGDVAAMPDGRLLCTLGQVRPTKEERGDETHNVNALRYDKLAVFDPNNHEGQAFVVFESPDTPFHSPVFLGPRRRPPVLRQQVDPRRINDAAATGIFFCQNARFTKNTTAGWKHVQAIRVLAGKGLTTRSGHSYIVHSGSEAIELGTVPLAPDGSFAIEVPADTPIAFQAVDGEGRSELNEMSWIYVRPGERRGCVGCHHTRQAAPLLHRPTPMATTVRPLKLLGLGNPHHFRGNNAAVTGMMELQFDRYREVAGLNRHDNSLDPTPTCKQEVETLVRQLREAPASWKITAAQRLSIFREPAAAPALVECLAIEPREVRVAAALALATCGTRESIPPLLDALTDPKPLVAQAAAVALENLGGHYQPFNPFVPVEERSPQIVAWRDWFTTTGWEGIERDLVARIASEDRDVVRRAAVALGHIGSSDQARAALRDYVVTKRADNPFIAWREGNRHRGDGARFNSLDAVNPRTLQAVTRSIGYLRDTTAVPMLAETIATYHDPVNGNLFLAEAAAEALGRIETPEAETALIEAFASLGKYPDYTLWYGDHPALMACHASPVHYLILESLDRIGSTRADDIVPHAIRSIPTDTDRGLFPRTDDCEAITGRVIRRAGAESEVVETCLSILGDPEAKPSERIVQAISTTYDAWGGRPLPEHRAAQILSLVCRDRANQPRVLAALDRYRATSTDIVRVFDTGIPRVDRLPTKHWVCFFLARTLGNLRDERSVDSLIAILKDSPPESAIGYPDPLGPGVLFLHNDLTPCWRAAVAWALGRIGHRRAAPVLLDVVANLDNAPDTRNAAAAALLPMAHPSLLDRVRDLATDYPEIATRRRLLELRKRCQGPIALSRL